MNRIKILNCLYLIFGISSWAFATNNTHFVVVAQPQPSPFPMPIFHYVLPSSLLPLQLPLPELSQTAQLEKESKEIERLHNLKSKKIDILVNLFNSINDNQGKFPNAAQETEKLIRSFKETNQEKLIKLIGLKKTIECIEKQIELNHLMLQKAAGSTLTANTFHTNIEYIGEQLLYHMRNTHDLKSKSEITNLIYNVFLFHFKNNIQTKSMAYYLKLFEASFKSIESKQIFEDIDSAANIFSKCENVLKVFISNRKTPHDYSVFLDTLSKFENQCFIQDLELRKQSQKSEFDLPKRLISDELRWAFVNHHIWTIRSFAEDLFKKEAKESVIIPKIIEYAQKSHTQLKYFDKIGRLDDLSPSYKKFEILSWIYFYGDDEMAAKAVDKIGDEMEICIQGTYDLVEKANTENPCEDMPKDVIDPAKLYPAHRLLNRIQETAKAAPKKDRLEVLIKKLESISSQYILGTDNTPTSEMNDVVMS